jgi:hypothetical protein
MCHVINLLIVFIKSSSNDISTVSHNSIDDLRLDLHHEESKPKRDEESSSEFVIRTHCLNIRSFREYVSDSLDAYLQGDVPNAKNSILREAN